MKTFAATLALVLVYCISYGQSATDEKAVQAVIQKMDDAWNAHDYSYSGKYDFYSQDATLVNPWECTGKTGPKSSGSSGVWRNDV